MGKLTPDRAFVRFWEMQDIVAWSECRPLVECFFDAADTWQSQGRHPIATAFYGQLLRMGLCVGHDRLVVRSLKGLLDLESSEPESIPMAICPHQLKRLVSVWLADSTEQADADKGPNPGRFEWMLSRAEALRQREQRVRLMHGLDGLIAFYAAPGSGVALNLRAVLLLPRWGELAATLDEEADARLEALLRSVLVAGEQLRAVGLSSVDQLLERTFAQMWTHMSERHSYPSMARLAVALANTSRRAYVGRLDPLVFAGVHRALSRAYADTVDPATRAQIRVEWLANHVHWIASGDPDAETSARSLLTVVSGRRRSVEEELLEAKLYLMLGHKAHPKVAYASQAVDLASQVIADCPPDDQAQLPLALMTHGLARLALAELGDVEPSDALVSLRRAQSMFRTELAQDPQGAARLRLASTLIALARGHLMVAQRNNGQDDSRASLLRQGAEYCQRARVLAQAAGDTLMTCQAMWVLSRILNASPGPERLNARHKSLTLALEAMDMLGVTYGTQAVTGIHTGGQTMSECLIHQYLGVVKMLGRYQQTQGRLS
ncbi:MAG: hypothetical protein AAFX99_15800 [Myxococcota bacterium]